MDSSEPLQVFVRNDKGKVWGPITLQTVELLIDSGALTGRLQVSKDGVNFAFPGRFPFIRKAFPRELWGDVVAPGDDDDFDLGLPVIPEVVAQEAAASPTPGTVCATPACGTAGATSRSTCGR